MVSKAAERSRRVRAVTDPLAIFLKTSLSKDDFLRIGVTWACLKKLGHVPCAREALIIEVMGVIRISRNSRTRKVGQGSREHDLVGES